jgi:hypothetical protein
VKIAAGCIFYNSEDIILLTIENLVAQGISDFYLIDHGSSDFATDLVFESLDGVANISIFKRESEKFLQGRMMTLLALLAKADGFDVFVPFDADEFLDTTSPELSLTNEISQLINDNQNFFLVEVVDYVQSVEIEKFTERNLSDMKYRAVVNNRSGDLKSRILKGGTTFARPATSYKAVINLNNIQIPDFLIHEGNHLATGFRITKEVTRSKNLVIRHAPFRSRARTLMRRTQGARRQKAGFSPDIGYQNQRLANLSEADLERYWLCNSYSLDDVSNVATLTIEDSIVDLVEDYSLEKIWQRILTRRIQFHDKSGSDQTKSRKCVVSAVNPLFDLAVDVPNGTLQFQSIKNQLIEYNALKYHLEQERETLLLRMKEFEESNEADRTMLKVNTLKRIKRVLNK